jgi:hypothetical protein
MRGSGDEIMRNSHGRGIVHEAKTKSIKAKKKDSWTEEHINESPEKSIEIHPSI